MKNNAIFRGFLITLFILGLIVWIGGMYFIYLYYQREIGYLLHPGGFQEWRGVEWYIGWFFATIGIILVLIGGIIAKLRYAPMVFIVIGSISILSSSMFLFNIVGDWLRGIRHISRSLILEMLGVLLLLSPFVSCVVAGVLIRRKQQARRL